MRAALWLLAFVSAPAIGQGVVMSGPGDVANALSAAQSAQSQASAAQQAAAAAQAAIPPECTVAPSKDSLNGTVGALKCVGHSDDTRPTAVQAGNVPGGLLANCTFSIIFSRAFTSSTPFIYAAVVDTSGAQMPCKIQTRSATGICNSGNSSIITLNALTAAALTGLTLNPFGTTCTAGTPVMFVGREPTQ